MSVLSEVVRTLDAAGVAGWQREIAEALASSLDDDPNASTAKELKSLMGELVGAQAEPKGDVSDDLAAKRAERRAASS